MLTQNSQLKQSAWEVVTENWKPAVLTTLVVFAVICAGACLFAGLGPKDIGASFGIATFLYWVFIFGVSMPLTFTFAIIMLNFLRGDRINALENTFNYFKENYSRAVITSAMVAIYTALWSLLFIIPGIIKSYAYAMTFYIADEMPEKSTEECIQLSMQIMYGNKAKLFLLDLSFIGWFLLCAITGGIAALFVQPYWMAARAAFYEDLKREVMASSNIFSTYEEA